MKISGRLEYLIEVKAIGHDLKDQHINQAVTYAAKEGVRWVVLTNGINWQVHRVLVDGLVTSDEIVNFTFTELSARKLADLETLYLLCKRGLSKDLMQDFFDKQQACNKFTIGALLISNEVATLVRRKLRKMTPGVSVSLEEVTEIISASVIKRDILESQPGVEAQKVVKRHLIKSVQRRRKTVPAEDSQSETRPLNDDSEWIPLNPNSSSSGT